MFDLRTAAAAALVGALTLAAPALAAAPAKAPATKAVVSAKPKKELHGFKRYDKNGDGVLLLAEYRASFSHKPKSLARADKRFKRWDKNGDGKVTKAEWDHRVKGLGGKKPSGKPAAKKK